MLNFANAFLYDPAVEFGQLKNNIRYRYIFNKPKQLPKYLEHFCPPDGSIKIIDGPKLSMCGGMMLSLVLSCRASWPKYVSYEEDSNLRNDEWNKKYDGKRVIM